MENEDIFLDKISPDFLGERQFFTKNREPIRFELWELPKEPPLNGQAIFTLCTVQAFVDDQPAGYVTLAYLSDEIKNRYFKNSMEHYIYQYGNDKIKSAYEDGNLKELVPVLCEKLQLSPNITPPGKNEGLSPEKYLKKQFKFLTKIVDDLRGSDYSSFINYWHNRPNVEMMYVYNQDDKRYKTFNEYPFTHETRTEQKSFRGQGISQALYEVAGLWMQSKNLYLHASTTQSADGKKMWDILENHPKFQVLADTFLTKATHNRKLTIGKERKKLYVI